MIVLEQRHPHAVDDVKRLARELRPATVAEDDPPEFAVVREAVRIAERPDAGTDGQVPFPDKLLQRFDHRRLAHAEFAGNLAVGGQLHHRIARPCKQVEYIMANPHVKCRGLMDHFVSLISAYHDALRLSEAITGYHLMIL